MSNLLIAFCAGLFIGTINGGIISMFCFKFILNDVSEDKHEDEE